MKTTKRVKPEQFSNCDLDLQYACQSKSQVLDIFLPGTGTGPFPTVILIHGGGWISGDKRDESVASIFKILSQGYALATVNYRLAQEAKWPAQIFDVKTAVRYIKANAEKWNLRTDKFIVWGNSAGGHLVQMLSATGNTRVLEDLSTGHAEQSSAVNGVICWYGVSDVYASNLENILSASEMGQVCNIKQADILSGYTPIDLMLGFNLLENRAACAMASPIEFVSKDFPKILLQHGTGDKVVAYVQSVRMYNKIIQVCGAGRARLELFEGYAHGDPRFKTNENINRCLEFMDEIIWGEKRTHTALPEIIME